MPVTKMTQVKARPLRGGAITARDAGLLPPGAFSAAQNVRPLHPGFEKRKGQAALHTTADSTNRVMSLYQFRKRDVDETHMYAQMSDGDVLEATNLPPAVATGVFGSEIYSGSAGQIPASWAAVADILVHSNGADQHQVYGGSSSYVSKFIKFDGAAAPTGVPAEGFDYTDQVTDGDASTVAVLDGLDTYAAFECLFIRTPVQAKSITLTIAAANANASTLTLYYPKVDNTWADTSATDNTASGGACLAVTGSITWTPPTDMIPKYLFGECGWWYQIRVSATLDAEVEISSAKFDSSWMDLANVWDGVPLQAVEVWLEGTSTYATHPAAAIEIGGHVGAKKIIIFSSDPVEGLYWDVGITPNATGTTITSLKYWDGDSFVTVGTTVDGTAGLSSSGWMTFPRQSAVQPTQFGSSQYMAYVYELILDTTISDDVIVGLELMPYFDITDFGHTGRTSCAWKSRILYSFDEFGQYLYVSSENEPQVLNGADFGILEAGDGRTNKVVGSRRFHNEAMVWQEERGVEGGCITLFEGYNPQTFGKLILSNRIGAFNNNCIEVVDGVTTSTATDEQIKTMAFSMGRDGVAACDGRVVTLISDDIQNYFDPTQTECVRRGYEALHWLKYDSAHGVLRMGIVSGTSASVPNVFPVFDLVDRVWYFDVLAQELSTMVEVEAGSGNVAVIQVGGGVDDGLVYQLNTGTNDVSTAISSQITIELSGLGEYYVLRNILLLMAIQSAGSVSMTVSDNGVAKISAKSLLMTAESSGETKVRRHLLSTNVTSQHISINFTHATASQSMTLYHLGLGLHRWDRR